MTADREMVRKALTGKGIGRTFKGRVKPLDGGAIEALLDDVVARLEARLIEMAGIARRAQVAAMGMDAVVDALCQTPAAPVVLTASDLSDRSRRRVLSCAGGATHFVSLSIGKAEFGSKLGRKDVGVVAIRPSVLAKRLVAEATRRDGLGALPQSRAREEGLIRQNGEPSGGRSN